MSSTMISNTKKMIVAGLWVSPGVNGLKMIDQKLQMLEAKLQKDQLEHEKAHDAQRIDALQIQQVKNELDDSSSELIKCQIAALRLKLHNVEYEDTSFENLQDKKYLKATLRQLRILEKREAELQKLQAKLPKSEDQKVIKNHMIEQEKKDLILYALEAYVGTKPVWKWKPSVKLFGKVIIGFKKFGELQRTGSDKSWFDGWLKKSLERGIKFSDTEVDSVIRDQATDEFNSIFRSKPLKESKAFLATWRANAKDSGDKEALNDIIQRAEKVVEDQEEKRRTK